MNDEIGRFGKKAGCVILGGAVGFGTGFGGAFHGYTLYQSGDLREPQIFERLALPVLNPGVIPVRQRVGTVEGSTEASATSTYTYTIRYPIK